MNSSRPSFLTRTITTATARAAKVAQRLDDLNSRARRGYEVRHTHVFQHNGTEIYADNLVKGLDVPI